MTNVPHPHPFDNHNNSIGWDIVYFVGSLLQLPVAVATLACGCVAQPIVWMVRWWNNDTRWTNLDMSVMEEDLDAAFGEPNETSLLERLQDGLEGSWHGWIRPCLEWIVSCLVPQCWRLLGAVWSECGSVSANTVEWMEGLIHTALVWLAPTLVDRWRLDYSNVVPQTPRQQEKDSGNALIDGSHFSTPVGESSQPYLKTGEGVEASFRAKVENQTPNCDWPLEQQPHENSGSPCGNKIRHRRQHDSPDTTRQLEMQRKRYAAL